jgi:predicted anti-sigma-YlaC factor YlaD
MDCKLCENDLERYYRGKLPPEISSQIREHLRTCPRCAQSYRLLLVTENVIAEEKNLKGNPYLVTRIMAELENENSRRTVAPSAQRILRPVLITVSLFIAITLGIVEGKLIRSSFSHEQIPVEVLVLNDSAVESVAAFTNP